MLRQPQTARMPAELRGEFLPLLERIGSPDGLAAIAETSGALLPQKISTLADLRKLLEFYDAHILRPLELPAIQRAHGHASRNELRELMAFDKQLADGAILKNFAAASRVTGLHQLQQLRPMRDLRLAQRYLAAVERGEAHGWHTLVYGLTLAAYSLPLRQGLLGYAAQTTRGFIQAASHSLTFSEAEADQLFAELSASFPAAVEALLAPVAIA